jgi:putative ABC transport system permease protein
MSLQADLHPSAGASPLIAVRFALRELRGGLRGFGVFLACIALGVMAIAGVGSLSESLTGGLAREGRAILGGDIAFSLIQREASAQERQFLEGRGAVSAAATMRAMVRTPDGRNALVEVKAVDGAYPLYGAVELTPAQPLGEALAARDGAFGAAADAALLTRLDLKPGARVTLGNATIEIRATIAREPDKLAGGIGFGPRLLIGQDALRASGLVQPGSLVRWIYRVKLPANDVGDRAVETVKAAAERALPEAGWDVRSRNNASPQLERNVDRFSQFLTLVGLTALLVGGVGVANAVKSHLDRKRGVIAAMKSLGATGARIFAIYLTQVLVLASVGAVIGAALGAALPFAISYFLGNVIPLPIAPALHLGQLSLAFVYGLLTALAFAIWPLGRAHDIPVSALFRDHVNDARRFPRLQYVAAAIAVVAALTGLAVWLAFDRRVAVIFVASAAAAFVALRLLADLIMAIARRLPHARATALRLAVANIHRPGALTPIIVLSLGLGVTLLVTVIQIDGNLRRQLEGALPEKAPSFFFVDIQSADADRFDRFIGEKAPGGKLERVPMLRGRVVALNGVRSEEINPPPNAAWVLQSDRGITYAKDVPAGSRIVEGAWWGPDYQGPPLVSFEQKLAEALGLKIGDPITVNVLGRNITATISNLRTVDWQSLGINFVIVFSPGTFAGAPHSHIATLTYPGGATPEQEAALVKASSDTFPSVTAVRVKDALDAIGSLVANLVLAIRGASGITLLAAALVLAGALAASHHHRVYDAVILKTLGATRAQLLSAYALEYCLLGLVTAVLGVAAGTIAAYFVTTEVMDLSFVFLPGPALVAAFGAIGVTIAFGLLGTYRALGQKPAPVLRNL